MALSLGTRLHLSPHGTGLFCLEKGANGKNATIKDDPSLCARLLSDLLLRVVFC